MEMLTEVERARALMETEKLRAVEVAKATANAEAANKEADAVLYRKRKEAEGTLALFKAQADGVQLLMESFQQNPNALLQYLMIERDLYQKLANANAQAVQGMEPKITVWNTESGGTAGYSKTIADVFKTLPPLLTTIHEQTGLKPSFVEFDKKQ